MRAACSSESPVVFRLVSLNLNGIRSAATKGFEAWAAAQAAADCMGVQEVKAQADTVAGRFDTVAGMKGHFHYADKKGYSGVGLYTRKERPADVILGIGDAEFDAEGRYVETRFDTPGLSKSGRLSIISCYFPSGSSGELRQAGQVPLPGADGAAPEGPGRRTRVHPGGRRQHRAQGNRPEELAQQPEEQRLPAGGARLDDDPARRDGPGRRVPHAERPHPEQYTWWSNRGQAWAKNVGWRLDYHLATPAIAKHAVAEHIYLEQRFSDHAPLVIDYDFTL